MSITGPKILADDTPVMSRSSKTYSILLVDPESLIRHTLKLFIDSITGFRVRAEADSAEEALLELGRSSYDLLITEIALPGPSGLELIRQIVNTQLHGPQTRVVVLSRISSLEVIKQALLAGAQGYVLKSGNPEDLATACHEAFATRKFVPPQITHLLDMPHNLYSLGNDGESSDPLHPLSPREREIFYLLASGLQNSVIAEKLLISPRTVETHRARVIQKLRLESSGELIHYAFRHNLMVNA